MEKVTTLSIEEIKDFTSKAFQYQKDKDQYILNKDIKGVKDFTNCLFDNGFEVRDCYYNWGNEIMYEISEAIQDCKDIQEVQSEIEALEPDTEPDVYTSELTNWLSSNIDHVYYLTEALEYGANDGFQLLQQAQSLHIQEVKGLVKQSLLDYLEKITKDL